jgi:hypothetical protein
MIPIEKLAGKISVNYKRDILYPLQHIIQKTNPKWVATGAAIGALTGAANMRKVDGLQEKDNIKFNRALVGATAVGGAGVAHMLYRDLIKQKQSKVLQDALNILQKVKRK